MSETSNTSTPSTASWTPLLAAAQKAQADGWVFESPIRGQRYRVQEVYADRIVVERLDANAPEVLTRAEVERVFPTIQQSGRVPRTTQFQTVAKEATLVALHPALRWDSTGSWIELSGNPDYGRALELYADYDRRAVHEIFSPFTKFTPQAGTWGLHGIVNIPERPGDYVVFVTFGGASGDHVFDEAVTEDGVLTWQSQPRESLRDARIRDLIQHDDQRNSIYLFLRTHRDNPYSYLGRLRYLSHDAERERPVHFRWQILPGNIPAEVAQRIGLKLEKSSSAAPNAPRLEPAQLVEYPPPAPTTRSGVATPAFRARVTGDRAEQDAKNRKLGRAGELLVVRHEKEALRSVGRHDLADQVIDVAGIEGDGAGYDVRSFWPDGRLKYIEVKTTRGSATTACFMSANELTFAAAHRSNFVLYRIYNYDDAIGSGEFFAVEGDLTAYFECIPTAFRLKAAKPTTTS